MESRLAHFLDGEGRLKTLPAKRKMKLHALAYLAARFEPQKVYTEKEVNALLNQWHTFGVPATLRRGLYDGRFLDRAAFGRSYWLEETQPTLEDPQHKLG